jgi:SAM-dependent methyltransferase
MTTTIPTWKRNPAEEQAMEDGHALLWERLIDIAAEPWPAQTSVLDFGCNQGGFLRRLHARKGFKDAVGIDIATDSVAIAQERRGDLPATYLVGDSLRGFESRFDIAFSHEVIYLLADLERHAREIHASLRPGGVYYAVTGCHTDNPEWPVWREDIRARSNVPPVDRSLDDYAQTFAAAGLEVAVRRFGLDAFVPVAPTDGWRKGIANRLHYLHSVKACLRLTRPG